MTKDYYGTKRVTAWPQERAPTDAGRHETAEDHQGAQIGPFVEGYAVKYADGYTSWSPKDVFEAAYKPITAMGFEGALAAMKAGHKVCRASWSPHPTRWTFVYLDGKHFFAGGDPAGRRGVAIAEAEDLLAEDWMIVEAEDDPRT